MFFSVLGLFGRNSNALTWAFVSGKQPKTAWEREKHQPPRVSSGLLWLWAVFLTLIGNVWGVFEVLHVFGVLVVGMGFVF